MKKIVIIGANDFQNQLILKAKEMGFISGVTTNPSLILRRCFSP